MKKQIILVPNSCRVCLRKKKRMRSLFVPLQPGDPTPDAMLRRVIGPVDSSSTSLPHNICKSCEMSLNLAFQFHVRATASKNALESLNLPHSRNEQMNNTDTDKTYPPSSNLVVELDSIDQNEYEFCTLDDEDDLIEECFLDDEPDDPNSVEFDYEQIKEELNDDDEICGGDESENDCHETDAEEIYNAVQSNNDEDVGNCNENQPYFTDETAQEEFIVAFDEPLPSESQMRTHINVKRKKLSSKKPVTTSLKKQRVKSSCYICDICGNLYAQRARLNAHRKCHNQELIFSCEICEKSFNLREKLRQHMITHSGSRPFKCAHCSRTFFYESVKRAHEMVHSGVKPFVCKEHGCKKAFAYAHVLKKHQLTHTDVKLYHCSYCDKDFRLRYHVTQHEQTKMHRRAVEAAAEGVAKHDSGIKEKISTISVQNMQSDYDDTDE